MLKKYLPWIIGGAMALIAAYIVWQAMQKKKKAMAAAPAAATATTTNGPVPIVEPGGGKVVKPDPGGDGVMIVNDGRYTGDTNFSGLVI